jgi:hypothetical protein
LHAIILRYFFSGTRIKLGKNQHQTALLDEINASKVGLPGMVDTRLKVPKSEPSLCERQGEGPDCRKVDSAQSVQGSFSLRSGRHHGEIPALSKMSRTNSTGTSGRPP